MKDLDEVNLLKEEKENYDDSDETTARENFIPKKEIDNQTLCKELPDSMEEITDRGTTSRIPWKNQRTAQRIS